MHVFAQPKCTYPSASWCGEVEYGSRSKRGCVVSPVRVVLVLKRRPWEPKCSKLYHLACIEGNKLVTFDERKKRSFTCPLHVCARCTSIGTSKVNHYNLIQCINCPLALHKPDCLVAGCEMLGQMHMVCYQHVQIHHNVQMYSHTQNTGWK